LSLDAELGAWERRLAQDPTDPEVWRALARHARRLPAPPAFLAQGDHLPHLLALLAAAPGSRELALLALLLLGLAPAEPAGVLGEHWERAPETLVPGEAPYDRRSGLPLHARTRRGGVAVRWVPPGPARLPGPVAGGGYATSVAGAYLGRFPVLEPEYARFLTETGATPPPHWGDAGPALRPVAHVDWSDARAFSAWAGGALPSDVLWLRAAQGGDLRRYPWGDADPTPDFCQAAWPRDVVATRRSEPEAGTAPAGASPFGLEDMAGCVAEWCADWHGNHIIPWKPGRFRGPPTGAVRVARGGSWCNIPAAMDLYRGSRRGHAPTRRYPYVGFRLAVPVPDPLRTSP